MPAPPPLPCGEVIPWLCQGPRTPSWGACRCPPAGGPQGSWTSSKEHIKCFKSAHTPHSYDPLCIPHLSAWFLSPFLSKSQSPHYFHAFKASLPVSLVDLTLWHQPHHTEAQLLVQTLHRRKCTNTYLGLGFDSPVGPQEQERKTASVARRHLLSHLDPKTHKTQPTSPSLPSRSSSPRGTG